MRYFVASGYIPSPHPPRRAGNVVTEHHFGGRSGQTRRSIVKVFQQEGLSVPGLGETVFLRLNGTERISVFVYGPYSASILIVTTSQRRAYLLGLGLRAVLTCFFGLPPLDTYQSCGFLLELSRRPSPEMDVGDLARLVSSSTAAARGGAQALRQALDSGTGLSHEQLRIGCGILAKAVSHPRLLDALMHLEYSRSLAWGFMVGSFYESHYRRERKTMARYDLERIYLESRLRFDSAFVATFRGLECVLGKPTLSNRKIPVLLANLDREFATSFSSKRHRAWHEVFSSRRKWWRYGDLIAHYLKLRNSVSAHGNPAPPYIVTEDQVLEVQLLLEQMLERRFSCQKDAMRRAEYPVPPALLTGLR